jgi:integrase
LPAAFAADAARYLALQAGADLTDPLAPPRALKPLSLRTRRYQVQQLVSALHHQGVDIRCFSSLADLCRPAYVRLALQYFITRLKDRKGPDAKPDTAMISGLAHTLKVIAKHYVQIEPAALEEITRIAGRLRRRPRGMTEKNQQRLTQLYDPQLLWRFVTFAREEMAKLADQRAPARLDAVRYSTLLAIELLTVAPMRVHNLTGLDLNRHFNRPTGCKRSPIRLTIPRDEVKNDQPLDYVLPDDTAACLHIYLDRFRPLLMCQPSSALFPSYKEGPKRSDTMSKQISRLLRKELGLDWNPHLFRHFAAKIKLQANPGDYEGTRRLLAHSSIETTARIYTGSEMRSAVEHYDRLIEEIRGPAPIRRAPRRRQAAYLRST